MSRYLEYSGFSNRDIYSQDGYDIKEAPERLGLQFLGVKPPFQDYLADSRAYKGGSYVACGGKFVTGQPRHTASSAVLIFAPGVFYFVTVLPLANLGRNSLIPGLQYALAAVILIAFCLGAFTNPGIIPREASTDKYKQANIKYESINDRPSHRYLLINKITIKQKFCITCQIFRPPRSKHCTFCDNCILRFDHHCAWLGNCVGLHNYRYFLCLIYSATVFTAMVIYVAVTVLIEGDFEDFQWSVIMVVFIVYSLLIIGAVLLLSIYHTIICIQNLTTNEHVKQYYKTNPFDFDALSNLRQVYCAPERVLARGHDIIKSADRPFDNGEEWTEGSRDDEENEGP